MNNKGFIATSLIYSFFLIFITLFLTIIADYLQNKVLLNTVEKSIKEDINNTMGIQDFEVCAIYQHMPRLPFYLDGQTGTQMLFHFSFYQPCPALLSQGL